MKGYFVPFQSGKPATITVNGHRLVVLSRDPTVIKASLPKLGGDTVKRLKSGQTKEDEDQFFKRLAEKANAGVVIAPGNLELELILSNLEIQLPWLQ